MKVPFIDLSKQYHSIKPEIDEAIAKVMEGGIFIGGEPVEQFAIEFARRYGVKHCIPVANGTDALYISMKMMGIGEGDEVIVAANVFVACALAIGRCGAKPVFVDIEEDYFTIDPIDIQKKITEKTKAIMPVHLFGQCCDMDAIMRIAEEHDLLVIEDCAQAHFSEYKDKLAGTFGKAASFSFYPVKNLGAYGDAGCIITNYDDLANRSRAYANYGSLNMGEYLFEGINSRLDTVQAAILNVKLKYVEEWNEKRIENAHYYSKGLQGIDGLRLPKVRPETRHTFHQFVVRSDRREALREHLTANGIATLIHYPTMVPFLKAFEYLGYQPNDFPVTFGCQEQILSLPLSAELGREEMDFVISIIQRYPSVLPYI